MVNSVFRCGLAVIILIYIVNTFVISLYLVLLIGIIHSLTYTYTYTYTFWVALYWL